MKKKRELLLEFENDPPADYIWEKTDGEWHCIYIRDEGTGSSWVKFGGEGAKLYDLCSELDLDQGSHPDEVWPNNKFKKITEDDLFTIFL